MQSSFEMAKLAVEIALGLIGLLALWSGLFRIAEQAGLVAKLSVLLGPLFRRLMPEVPTGHEAHGAVTMNLAANMLGLDNAATPLGLKAMEALQKLNPDKQTASNAQILFLVLNTSSVTLIPVTIFMYRAQLGSVDPTAVFVPILLATLASSTAGLASVMWIQKIPFDRVIAAYLGGFLVLMSSTFYGLSSLSKADLSSVSQTLANGLLLAMITVFLGIGIKRKLAVYEVFVDGAKQGFDTAVRLIPYLVAMLVAIGMFRASGALNTLVQGISDLVAWCGLDTQFVEALPVAFIKPFSGSGARAMMLDVMNAQGVDSFVGQLAAVMQGSTETTFYVLTVYFGAVGITRMRYAIWAGLLCDVVGITSAIFLAYWFF